MGVNFGNVLQATIGGAATGSAVPGVGTITGGIIGGVGSFFGGLFGGGGVPNHEDPDEIKIATTYGITQQQASTICGYEESQQPKQNYDEICSKAASDRNYFLQIWEKYNRDHSYSPILPQQPSQAVNTQAAGVQQQQSNAQGSFSETPSTQNNNGSPTSNTSSNTTTYALIGGGALLAIIIAILLLKK